ncbi:MAG: DUF2254 domain-containing protein [Theionarchaea archaeon]|nr:DUF2254 domain-containing protein [Theionarchaea archaeon]
MTETVIRKHPWLGYPIIFLCVILLYFVIIRFNLLHTNEESAHYMLSALVQSEAAIIAIVVTLSLVVVQLTASFYSAKITKIFRKSPDLWILMISYIGAMIYSLVVLLMIEEVNSVLNIEKYIFCTKYRKIIEKRK